jgi:hypothetical protein
MVNLYMLRKKRKDLLLPWPPQRILSNKNGLLSILINQRMKIPRAIMKNTDSTSIDHSILDQECHSTELLNAEEPVMLESSDGEPTPLPNNGSSILHQRLSRTTNGRATHFPFKETT